VIPRSNISKIPRNVLWRKTRETIGNYRVKFSLSDGCPFCGSDQVVFHSNPLKYEMTVICDSCGETIEMLTHVAALSLPDNKYITKRGRKDLYEEE